jgi:lipoprotein-anchoring transpeptidase ErfK/SrfK
MKSAMLALLALSGLGAPALALANEKGGDHRAAEASAPAEVRLAQFYDPAEEPYYDDGGRGTQTFVDEYGRTVTVDRQGRIISVERPRRRQFEERRRPARERGEVVLSDPRESDGLILEGPVNGGAQPRSADPYYDGPIESAPLPDPLYDDGTERNAALPDALDPGGLPADRGSAPIFPGETTAPESRPAPAIVGPKGKNASIQIAALQVLLDRAGISPGVIDGRMGSNVDKAVAAYEEKFGTQLDATDAKSLAEQLDESGGPAIVSYTITEKDIAGPYLASIPEDYSEKAKLPAMSYTRVTEMLGERFHMDEDYLKSINPGADFNRPGTVVKVMSVGANVTEPVARIIADKGREQVRAYDATGRLVAAYPSTIGSSDTPSPSGTVQVSRIAFDPNYTYNPKINFTQGSNKSILTIPPGPNGPVGTIWIALSKPTYGIHGTPEPSKIGKTNSHGCVRLANFDAQELAKLVKAGVTVEFIE